MQRDIMLLSACKIIILVKYEFEISRKFDENFKFISESFYPVF